MSLQHKIDFAVVFSVNNANPNGDPLNGNRPRLDYGGYGEITDVCLKRKIRDRLQENGHSIFVQSDEKKNDGMPNLKARAEGILGADAFKPDKKDPSKKEKTAELACQQWFDVRAFGQLFAFKDKKSDDSASGTSIPIRGPVSIQSAFSLEAINIISSQITKSVNAQEPKNQSEMSSDRIGMKHRVDKAVYVAYGAMTPQLAERTGFNDEDAETIKQVLPRLFEGDASSARPEGSMSVEKVIWWKHNSKSGQYSSAKVHRSLRELLDTNGNFDESKLKEVLGGLEPEIIPGF
jgi:CRISPR-associated protein Csd2